VGVFRVGDLVVRVGLEPLGVVVDHVLAADDRPQFLDDFGSNGVICFAGHGPSE